MLNRPDQSHKHNTKQQNSLAPLASSWVLVFVCVFAESPVLDFPLAPTQVAPKGTNWDSLRGRAT